MKHFIAFIISALAVLAMCVFIFMMSHEPADASTELSMGIVWHIVGFVVPGYDQMSPAEQLYWQSALDHPVRKTAHFLEYAALGALSLNMFKQAINAGLLSVGNDGGQDEASRRFTKPLQIMGVAWAFTILYAASDELHQIFVPGRAGMITDIALDAAGALTGIVLLALIMRALDKRKEREGC